MTNASYEELTTRLRDNLGSSLRGVAVHSNGDAFIHYAQEAYQDPDGTPTDNLSRWLTPPSPRQPSPRAVVSVFSKKTAVHISHGNEEVISIVLDAGLTRDMNSFLDWCHSAIVNERTAKDAAKRGNDN